MSSESLVTRPEFEAHRQQVSRDIENLSNIVREQGENFRSAQIAEAEARREDTTRILHRIDTVAADSNSNVTSFDRRVTESKAHGFTVFSLVIALLCGLYGFMDARVEAAHDERHKSFEQLTHEELGKISSNMEAQRDSLSSAMIERDKAIKAELSSQIDRADHADVLQDLSATQSAHSRELAGMQAQLTMLLQQP